MQQRGRPPAPVHTSRRSALAAVGAGGAALLPGCNGARRVLGGTPGGQITLEYLDVQDQRSRETFEPVVAELEASYDETIEIEFTEVPYDNMFEQLQMAVGGNDPPDVAAIDQIWLGRFADAGALLELDALADDRDLDDYLDPFVDVCRFDGHQYAFPITTDVRGTYWDRDAFESAGLDPAAPPATWSELLDAAEQLHDPPQQYGATCFVNGGRWTVPLFAAGGEVLGPDGTEPRFHEEPGVRAAQFLDDLYNERGVGPPEPQYRDAAETARQFLQGQAAITVVEGSWLDFYWRNLGNEDEALVEQFGFGPTPAPADGERTTMSGGWVWAGFEGTDHPDVVRDFLRAATGREFMRHLAADAGQIPTRESLLDADAIWDQILYADAVRELLESTRLRPVRNWSPVATELDPALQRVAFDEAAPEAALSDAADRVRSELQ